MGTLKLVLVYIMYKTDDLTEEEISCKNMDSMVKYWSHTRIKSGRREIDPENLLIRKPILMVTKNILQIVIAVIISTREALGFWGLRFWPQKKIRFFGCGVFRGLRIFRFSAFGFRFSSKTLSGLRIRYANGFRFLFDLSSNFAPPLISNSCETLYAPFVTNVWDQLGFCQLGCENLSVLTILQAVLTDFIFFVLFFLQFWIIFSTVLRFLINPNAYPRLKPVPHKLSELWVIENGSLFAESFSHILYYMQKLRAHSVSRRRSITYQATFYMQGDN